MNVVPKDVAGNPVAALSQTLPAPGEVEQVKQCWSAIMREFGHAFGDIDKGYYAEVEDMRKAVAALSLANDEGVNFRALLIEAGRNAGALLDDRVSDDFLKGIPEEVRLKIERLREDTRTIQRNTATYRQEARAEADAANERAAEANKRADNMAEANRRLLAMFEADPTSLATSRSQHEGASS